MTEPALAMKTKLLALSALALLTTGAYANAFVYNLNGAYAATNPNGPSLVPHGGTLGPDGYTFGVQQGLSLSGTGIFDVYSIDIRFYFDDINASPNGFQRILEFKNLASDTGLLEKFGGHLWKGKVFFRDQRVLRNTIQNDPALLLFIDNPSTVMSDTIRGDGLFGRIFKDRVWLLFPAKLYCGQSLLDTRRESVIVDYHFADDIEGYRAQPDSLAGRGGLRIRDEIRMVRPGFYLGRANRMFLLNFTLFNPDVAQAGEADFLANRSFAEDCWPAAEQIRGAAR